MNWKRRLLPFAAMLAGMAVLGAVISGCADQRDPAKAKNNNAAVELKKADLEDVLKYVESQKGKVVVADVWGFFCEPCKEEFPNLVKMHNKYDANKFTAMSICLDIEPEKDYDNSLKFLQSVGATFANFQLKSRDQAADKWNIIGLPAAIVWDQQGNAKVFRTDVFTNEKFSYADVIKHVESLLQK